MTGVRLNFEPYRRRGAAALGTLLGAANQGRRAFELSTQVVANSERFHERSIVQNAPPLTLYGPGDVVGIDPTQITRRSPNAGDLNAEPNYLAAVELEDPALPWLFSLDVPAQSPGGRLMPWLMLIVVEEAGHPLEAQAGRPRPSIKVNTALLPDPKEAWAWAHIQERAGVTRSRLLCPTRLKQFTRYRACVVPVYEVGRRAGLNQSFGTFNDQTWSDSGSNPVELPVYEHWVFGTGAIGDFETLASALGPVSDYKELGFRRVAIAPVESMLHAQGSTDFTPFVYDVDTAFGNPTPKTPPAPGSEAAAAADELVKVQSRIDEVLKVSVPLAPRIVSPTDEDPIVGPPLYGQWHAAVTELDHTGNPKFINTLNLDPAHRIAAGLGTQIVRRDQEKLMASAWRQLAQVLEVNRRVRWTQLYAASSQELHRKLGTVSEARRLRIMNPALARARIGAVPGIDMGAGVTAAAALHGTALPRAALDGSFVRNMRYAARPSLRALSAASVRVSSVTIERSIANLANDDARVVPALPAKFAVQLERVQRVLDVESVKQRIEQELQQPVTQLLAGAGKIPSIVEELAVVHAPPTTTTGGGAPHIHSAPVTLSAPIGGIVGPGVLPLTPTGPGVTGAAIEGLIKALTQRSAETLADYIGITTKRDEVVDQVMAREAGLARLQLSSEAFGLSSDLKDEDATLLKFHKSTLDDLGLRATMMAAPKPAAVAPGVIANPMFNYIDPYARFGAMLRYAHKLDQALTDQRLARQRSPFHPIMAAPQFPDALVDRLKEIDRSWALGGVELLPPNSISLFSCNRKFTEALLVGANHEMSSELRWRGYPTDMRGSYFRRFWPTTAEEGSDPQGEVIPLHEWVNDLGDNRDTRVLEHAALTMVVIKGQLLRRYPQTIITAEKGKAGIKNGLQFFESTGPIARPVFHGQLGDDVSYVALSVDINELQETPVPGQPSWYISIEQPSELPRFGMDDVPGSITSNPQAFDEASLLKFTWQGVQGGDPGNKPGGRLQLRDVAEGNPTSSQIAKNLYQQPYRVLMHAFDYLPKKA